MKKALTFDDVLIVPGYSEVESRFDPLTTSPFLDLEVPIISANMDTVTNVDMAIAMEKAGGMGVLHRFYSREDMLDRTNDIAMQNSNVAVSIGIGEPHKVANWARELVDAGANIIVIDVAHGYQKRVVQCVEAVKEAKLPVILVAGNIATTKAAIALWNAGADAVKVGIGPGAACTTRTTTGVGYPQFSAIRNIAEKRAAYRLSGGGVTGSIIADGGIKNTGDFCKAIAAGADAVMMGSILAGADESAAPITTQTVENPWFGLEDCPETMAGIEISRDQALIVVPSGRKEYRGMASTKARDAFGIGTGTGYNEHIPEGVAGTVPMSGPVADTLDQYNKALQSSMSYVGASNVKEFHMNADFVIVTSSSIVESGSRI